MLSVYLNDTITVKRFTGRDQWGEPLAYTNEVIQVRLRWESRLIRDTAGSLVQAEGYVLTSATFSHEDRVEIGGVVYSIVAIHEKGAFRREFSKVWFR